MVTSVQSIRMIFLAVSLLPSCMFGLAIQRNDFAVQSSKFSLDFYRSAFKPDKNLILSPISIQSTISFLYHVANEQTSLDMQKVLGLPAKPEQLISNLQNFFNRSNSDDLRVVSKIYHGKLPLNPKFLPILQGSLDVAVESMDFSQKQKLADSVNQWAERSTKGLVREILKVDDIEDSLNVILLNAIVLDAKWKHAFWPFPRKYVFHFANGDHKVDIMMQEDLFAYGATDGFKALELPYEDHTDMSMVLIMPTDGSLEDLVKRFDLELYQKVDSILRVENVDILLPKFNTSSKIDAAEILESMGLHSAFQTGAFDVFDGVPAQLTKLRQNAVIEVSESGTKAAAVTLGMLEFRSNISPYFIADRPFMYVIRRISTKEIIFIGHLSHFE